MLGSFCHRFSNPGRARRTARCGSKSFGRMRIQEGSLGSDGVMWLNSMISGRYNDRYTLVMTNIAIEHGDL